MAKDPDHLVAAVAGMPIDRLESHIAAIANSESLTNLSQSLVGGWRQIYGSDERILSLEQTKPAQELVPAVAASQVGRDLALSILNTPSAMSLGRESASLDTGIVRVAAHSDGFAELAWILSNTEPARFLSLTLARERLNHEPCLLIQLLGPFTNGHQMSNVGIVSDWLSSDEEAAGDLAAYIDESGAAMDLCFEMRDGEAREFLLSMSQSEEGQHLASAFAASEAGLDAARYFAGHIAPDLIQAIGAMDLQLVELHGARDAAGLLLVAVAALHVLAIVGGVPFAVAAVLAIKGLDD